ncbi:MAG: Type 1 glutamine amidotransferase-like domain-containing protein [Chloroflexi bacterium]|nr:Type 1 glutamine amidotransferase-like domain-containing protein [Chloroflexota bacterium]
MAPIDRLLLAQLPPGTSVALLPTASGREPGAPARWNALGEAHFRALGATPLPILLLRREDAFAEPVLAALRQAQLFYFSGGDPLYLVETLANTPAWEQVRSAHAQGAGLAGCSAGAMMLGGAVLRFRTLFTEGRAVWAPGLAVVPHFAVLPHFDRLVARLGAHLAEIVASAPVGTCIVGIEEETALVRCQPRGAWQVLGRGRVHLYRAGQPHVLARAGEQLVLEE